MTHCAIYRSAIIALADFYGGTAAGGALPVRRYRCVPYTSEAQLDRLVERVSVHPVRITIHVGDIKSGSTMRSDEIFEVVKWQFNSFDQPLIYTLGDNERIWPGCAVPPR